MDRMIVKIGGLDLELALSFGVGREIAAKVADPLAICREAQIEAMMSQAGLVHSPKWVPTVDNVPLIIWIGAKHGGGAVKLEEVQDAVFRHGFLEARVIALDFIAALSTPTAREKIDAKGADDPGE